MELPAHGFLLDFFLKLRRVFTAVVLKLKNKRVFALVLILLLLFLLAFLKWWTSRGQVAAVYQTEIPQGISKDSLGNLSEGQKRLLDEMIARNLQSRTRLTLAAARPAVVILTQNNQPILPGASVQRPIGGPTGPTQTPGTATPSSITPPTPPTLTLTPSPTPIPSGPLIIEAEDLVDWANPSVSGWEKPCGTGFCTASTHWTTSTNPLNFAYFSPISHNLQAVVERGPNRGSFIIQSTNPTRSATLNLRQQGDFTFPTIDLLTGLSAGSQQITITPNGDGFVTFDKFILPAGCTLEQGQPASDQCTDSDNGMNYFVKGTTTGYFIDDRFLSLNDSCQSINPDGSNPDWVLEYHCETAGSTPQGRTSYISTSSFHCPNGCQDGACKGTPATPTPAPACTDSDEGLNYFVKGVVSQSGDPLSPHTDYCTEIDGISWDKSYLIEYTCENNHWKMNTYDCPNGCQDGVCKGTPSLTCTDSDGGKNYAVKGHLVGEMEQPGGATYHLDSYDACTDATRLSEYYCYVKNGKNYGTWETYNCAAEGTVCEDGVCKGMLPPSQCTETDGGKNFYQKGVLTSGAGTTFTDYCLSGASPLAMTEFWCKPGTIWAMESFACPNGCQDGACKSGSPVTTSFLPVAGANFLVSSLDNGQWDWQTAKSTCASLGARLPTMAELNILYQQKNNFGFQDESYWSSEESGNSASYVHFSNGFNSQMAKDFVNVFYRCVKDSSGAQVHQCTDSDGINYFQKGTLVDKSGANHVDHCVKDQNAGANPNYLAEYACQYPSSMEQVAGVVENHVDKYFVITYDCPSGCQDGICKGTPPPVTRGAPSISLEGEASNYYQDKSHHSLFTDILKIYQELEGKFVVSTRAKIAKIRLSTAPTSFVNYFDASTREIVLSPQNLPSREELTSLVAFALYDEQIFLKPKVFEEEMKKLETENVPEKVFGTPVPATATPKPPETESKAPAKKPTPTPRQAAETTCASGWQGYADPKFGFKLKIPAGWTDDSIDEQQSEDLIYRRLISTLNPPEQMDPKYKISFFEILVSSKDLKTHENYGTWFDNNTGNQKKSSVTFKGIQAEKYIDETEVACASQTEEMINCAHRFEMYYFQKDNLYYLLNIGLYLSADVKEKNEQILSCFLDNFELIEKGAATSADSQAKTVPDGLKPCTEEIFKLGESHCNDLPKKPVCGYSKLVFDNGSSRVDVWDYANVCFYCSQFDKTGFSELRGTKFYSLGYQEGVCQ